MIGESRATLAALKNEDVALVASTARHAPGPSPEPSTPRDDRGSAVVDTPPDVQPRWRR